MTRITATRARGRLFELLKGALRKHLIYRISHREGDVVLLAEEEYESLIETLGLLETPGFRKSLRRAEEDVRRGRVKPLDRALPAR